MSNTNTGGPAFPIADPFAVKCPSTDVEALRIQQGMTMRDYFAAKAMQAMVQKYSHEGDVSRNAYKIADAMLKARQA